MKKIRQSKKHGSLLLTLLAAGLLFCAYGSPLFRLPALRNIKKFPISMAKRSVSKPDAFMKHISRTSVRTRKFSISRCRRI